MIIKLKHWIKKLNSIDLNQNWIHRKVIIT